MANAKTMNRSRNQLATAYAPESFFTFEGGLGACISRSTPGERADLAETTIDLIYERLNELGRAWFRAAMSARDGEASQPKVLPGQCVSRVLLDQTGQDFQVPGQDKLYLCRPTHMEYTPAPLSFVCRTCSLFKDFESLADLDRAVDSLVPSSCPNPKGRGHCEWEQLDVVFVHWSGQWQAPFPGQYQWNSVEKKVAKLRDACICGSYDFRLNRRAPGIGDWFFECARCDKPLSKKWLQNDQESLRLLGSFRPDFQLTEVRMQATPYRASNAYYVKSDLFIDFKDGSQQLLTRLRPGREEELKDFVATQFGFAAAPIRDEDVEAACKGKDECAKDLDGYRAASNTIIATEPVIEALSEPNRSLFKGLLDQAYQNKQGIISDLRRRSILIPKVELPASVLANLRDRQSRFASKFDPIRLAVEHATLRQNRLDVEKSENGKKKYVSFMRLDQDISPESPDEAVRQQKQTTDLLQKLCVADMGLIREFDLCMFSYGYSRMESTPVLPDKRGMNMPVRLNLFPPVRIDDRQKAPIYVIQQSNEAIYVRLDERAVLDWLGSLECDDMFELAGEEKIGAGIIGVARPMRAFLDELPQSATPPVYFYLYSLLHSFSHLLMKHISEYSGLDPGSLGEYLFPADLAFVVYRNGTTMDLGNLSALWRNSGNAMLMSMLSLKATQCGTGSLCAHRGGACPDCLMVPETSCVASNKLLSRAVLRSVGGRASRIDTRPGTIHGFFDFARKV